jgi:hypothetical protein
VGFVSYFFITKREGVLPAQLFREWLRSRWLHAEVEEVLNSADIHALEFRVPMKHSRVDGALNREGDSVVFIGDFRDCAEFALWCHGLLPAGEPVTFCDEGMSGSLELEPSTTLADIFNVFRYEPPLG